MADEVLSAVIELKDQMSGGLRDIRREMDRLNGTGDKTGSGMKGVSKNFGLVKSGALAAAAGITAMALGMGKLIQMGMELEKYQISMKHWVANANPGMSAGDVSKTSGDYLKWLRKNADATPFETGEVIASGSRALGITGGDIAKSKELVKLSEDMAALTPGKTVMDATEAIADAQMGEFERMKEFGVKLTQEQVKAAGGIDKLMATTVTKKFKGGAAELASSGAGMWSTITGNIKSSFADVGLSMLESMKPAMSGIIDFFNSEEGKGAIKTFGAVIGGTFNFILKAGGLVGQGLKWLGDEFGWLGKAGKSGMEMFDEIKPTLKDMGETIFPIFKSAISAVSGVMQLLWDLFEASWPTIQTAVENVWVIIKPIFILMKSSIDDVAGAISTVIGWFDRLSKTWNDNPFLGGVIKSEIGKKGSTLALGTSYARGGMTLVGERGPEMVNLPRGSQVTTASTTKRQLNGGAPVFHININGLNKSTAEIMNELIPQLKLGLANSVA